MSGDRKHVVVERVVGALKKYVHCFYDDRQRQKLANDIWSLYVGNVNRKYCMLLFPVVGERASGGCKVFTRVDQRVAFFNEMANIILGEGKWLTNPEEEKKQKKEENISVLYRSDDYWMRFRVLERNSSTDLWWVMNLNVIKNEIPRGMYRDREEQDDRDEYEEMRDKGILPYRGRHSGGEAVRNCDRDDYEGNDDTDKVDSEDAKSDDNMEDVTAWEREDRPRGDGAGMSDYAVVLRELHERLKILEAKQGVA
jgi:hypothetical protein